MIIEHRRFVARLRRHVASYVTPFPSASEVSDAAFAA